MSTNRSASAADTQPTSQSLTITRVFDAPRALVFQAWTEPARLVEWFGPRGFTTHSCTMDVRPGGTWRLCMRRPDGVEHWLHGVYREVIVPERLVSTWVWERGATDFDDWVPGGIADHESELTVTLEDREGRTALTLHHTRFESAGARHSHHDGWTEALDRLAESVNGGSRASQQMS